MDKNRDLLSHVARLEFGSGSEEKANLDKYDNNLLRMIRQGRLDGAKEKNIPEGEKTSDGLPLEEIEAVLTSERLKQDISEEGIGSGNGGPETENGISEAERKKKEEILAEMDRFYGGEDKRLEKERILAQVELFHSRAVELDGKFNSDEQPLDVTKYGRLNGELSVLGKDIVAFAETLSEEQLHDEKISPRLDELIGEMFRLRGLVGWADKL